MKNILALILLTMASVQAADTDIDGVEDRLDACPNTPFGDLVTIDGCSKQTLFTQTHYDVILGASYANTNPTTQVKADTATATFQADIYRDNLSAQIATSFFRSDDGTLTDDGWNDTQLMFFYQSNPWHSLSIQTGAGVILPTYKTGYGNEAADYAVTLSLHYKLNPDVNLLAGYGYTFVNDADVPGSVSYQNTQSMYAGIAYNLTNGFVSASYVYTDSIYTGTNPIETLSLGSMLPLDEHWFVLGDYRYGLSDSASDHEIAVRIGYYF